MKATGAAMNCASHNATEADSCEHDREHDCECSHRRRYIQPQESEPNHFQCEENAARAKAHQKQAPRRTIARVKAQREFGPRRHVAVFNSADTSAHALRGGTVVRSCNQKRDCGGDAEHRTRRHACAVNSKCANQTSFAKHSAGHRSQCVRAIKKTDCPSKVRLPKRRVLDRKSTRLNSSH